MNYYPFHIGDYASHTRGLSLLEDLAYRRLIDEYYLAERPFNGCSTDVARLIGMAEHEAEVAYVLNRYFVQEGELWRQDRIEKELESFKIKQDAASRAGKASAESRKNKGKATDVQRPFNERSTDVQRSSTNQEPRTNISKPKGLDSGARKKNGSPLPENFQPDATGIVFAEQRGIALETEVENFRNWHQAKGSLMVNWQAAWRTWCGKARQFTKPAVGNAESFYERDQRLKTERMAAFTGKAPRQAGNVIDVTPTVKQIGGAK